MKSIEYINDHRGIAGSSFKHSRDRVPVSNQVQSATGTRSYPPAWLPVLTELRQKPGGTIGFAGIPRRRCADWLVVALDRAITPLSPVLPPRPALPLLPGPKVSEPRRKSRRELPVVVRRRVFRARHACVSLFLSSLSLSVSLSLFLFLCVVFVRVFLSAEFRAKGFGSVGSSPTLRSIAPDAKVETVQYRDRHSCESWCKSPYRFFGGEEESVSVGISRVSPVVTWCAWRSSGFDSYWGSFSIFFSFFFFFLLLDNTSDIPSIVTDCDYFVRKLKPVRLVKVTKQSFRNWNFLNSRHAYQSICFFLFFLFLRYSASLADNALD